MPIRPDSRSDSRSPAGAGAGGPGRTQRPGGRSRMRPIRWGRRRSPGLRILAHGPGRSNGHHDRQPGPMSAAKAYYTLGLSLATAPAAADAPGQSPATAPAAPDAPGQSLATAPAAAFCEPSPGGPQPKLGAGRRPADSECRLGATDQLAAGAASRQACHSVPLACSGQATRTTQPAFSGCQAAHCY